MLVELEYMPGATTTLFHVDYTERTEGIGQSIAQFFHFLHLPSDIKREVHQPSGDCSGWLWN